ncbi:MAG: hypothetical protein PHD18_02060 [Tolumonas sp.]|nr:hypothetical protein [Tolumonas sp.]
MPQATPNNTENSNFGFLKKHDRLFFVLANSAEQAFVRDPDIRNVFHALRIAGNKAALDGKKKKRKAA